MRDPVRRHVAALQRLPRVAIHLPIRNEAPETVRRTLDALSCLDYPAYDVLVIDSNTDDPARWEPVAEHCARLGARFRFFHLGEWPGGKSGALNFALGETVPEAAVVAVLDSGEVVRPDWLRRMVPNFADPAVGFARSPCNPYGGSPWLADQASGFAGAAVVRQDAMMLVRRSALEQAGGWAECVVAEDAELGLRLLRQGWRDVWSAESFGGRPAPSGFGACSRHRFLQVFGAVQACRMHCAGLLSPSSAGLKLEQRIRVLGGCMSWLPAALGVLLLYASLLWSAGLLVSRRPDTLPAIGLMLIPLLLTGLALAQVLWRPHAGHPGAGRSAAALAEFALHYCTGKAFWAGLLRPTGQILDRPDRDDVNRPTFGLASVHQELFLLLASWGAAVAIVLTPGASGPQAWTWCAMLLVQSLPCLAAVLVATAAPGWLAAEVSRVARRLISL